MKHQCDQCEKSFPKPHGLEIHKARMHGPNAPPKGQYRCKTCGQLFGSMAALSGHMKKHGQGKSRGAMLRRKHLEVPASNNNHVPIAFCPYCGRNLQAHQIASTL